MEKDFFTRCLLTGMFRLLYSSIVCLAAGLFAAVAGFAQTENDQRIVSFNRDVRPILSNHCYACHGPDEKTREAGLRLDIPNDEIDFDTLIDRITSDDPSEIMPPPEIGKPLGEHKSKILRDWVATGAKYEKHWSFVPPIKPPVPEGKHSIDHFIDCQLADAGMKRSKPADPATLVRRVYLDLIGLPPTIAQADEYIKNPSPKTYEKIVDELLASPRYGERWARRWLDLARYADTNGYEKDRDRSIWPYRDWVIRSINSGMPFDQFTIEQIAGDMLPNATADQIVATGFHRNTMLNEEGGIDPLEYRYYAMVDRVGTTGSTWLGLTTGCAQCHTHKFDPITHEEYFGMMAFLDNADEPDFYLPISDSAAKQKVNEEQAQKLLAELPRKWPKISKKYSGPTFEEAFSAWLSVQQRAVADWQIITPLKASTNLPNIDLKADGVVTVSGDTTKHDTYVLEFDGLRNKTTAIRLEALPDERLPGFGPGLTYYEGRKGDFFLSEIRLEIFDSTTKKWTPLTWGEADHTFAKNQFNHPVSAELATDGDIQSGWSVASRPGEQHVAVFNLEKSLPANTPFRITMDFGRHFASSLGKFRLSAAESQTSLMATTLSAELCGDVRAADANQNNELKYAFAMQAAPLAEYAKAIRRLQRPVVGTPTLVFLERTTGHERETYLRHRGEFTQPKQVVNPHLPNALVEDNESPRPKNRLQFARWLVSQDNPLTARVVANRQWAAFFGTGIVPTLDDFGMQGEPPSHPQLLDYLAVDLMENDWSMKKLHRLIVTSATYKQSSTLNSNVDQSIAKRLLTQFPRTRLEAEIIRDSALFAAGRLNNKLYGKPVRPTQPEGAAANFSQSKWTTSPGKDRFRRSIYTYQKRTAPFAMFTTFDAGSGESCLARRDVSNTPLQALTLMNDPMFVEIAEAYGKRIETIEGDVQTKLKLAFRWALTRSPEPDELKMLSDFYQKHRNWTAMARVLLCLDETINKN